MRSKTAPSTPTVSVVLPIFNRYKFLPAAFAAIQAQQVPDIQIVVVDDGSTDESAAFVRRLDLSSLQVSYIRQDNQGPYGARNTGVQAATGKYVAFYDSDDVWRPHHLKVSIDALESNPDVDWVYAACEIVDLESGRLLDPTSFYLGGRGRPFMALQHDRRGPLRVITDRGAIRCQIDHGLFCGLQNSVLRRTVFDRLSFEAQTRNEAEDQLFAIRALAAGFRLGYIDDVHVRYHVHDQNSSGPTSSLPLAKRLRVYQPLVAGYERLEREVPLTASDRRALHRRIGHDLFWHVGYNGYWAAGERAEALRVFRAALARWPWSPGEWKTFLLAMLRARLATPSKIPARP